MEIAEVHVTASGKEEINDHFMAPRERKKRTSRREACARLRIASVSIGYSILLPSALRKLRLICMGFVVPRVDPPKTNV